MSERIIPETHTCSKCGETKSSSDFRRDSRMRLGILNVCLKCSADYGKARRKETYQCKLQDTMPPLPIIDGARILYLPGHPGYACSDTGLILSCVDGNKYTSNKYSASWRVLRSNRTPDGYPHVRIRIQTGRSICQNVHSLILLSFVGPRPEGYVCRHLDGSKTNNNLSNICWGTPKENSDDRLLHGRTRIGSSHSLTKFSDDDVREMRRLYLEGTTRVSIAKTFNASVTSVCDIVSGKSRRYVT